jgi:hypothetical protein
MKRTPQKINSNLCDVKDSDNFYIEVYFFVAGGVLAV